MHYSLILLFLGTACCTPLGYYLLNPFSQYTLGTQPVVIALPQEGEILFDCKEAGSFPNRENACKSYFVCIEQGNTGTFSVRIYYFFTLHLLIVFPPGDREAVQSFPCFRC